MKIRIPICIVTIAGAIILSSGCKRTLPTGTVSFAGPGIELVPGADWQQVDARNGQGQAGPPVLKGLGRFGGGTIQIHWTAVRSDAQTEVIALRSKVTAKPEVLQDSFEQEDFVSQSGVRGIHFSYGIAITSQGGVAKFRADVYFFQNKKGHCVGISCLAPADRDFNGVHQMILNTLTLE